MTALEIPVRVARRVNNITGDPILGSFDYDGCNIADHCVECPLAACKYDVPIPGSNERNAKAVTDQVRKLRDSGHTSDQTAAALGISLTSVWRHRRKIDAEELAQRQLLADEHARRRQHFQQLQRNEQVAARRAAGEPIRSIAESYGVSSMTIHRWLRTLPQGTPGTADSRRVESKAKSLDMLAMWNAGHSYAGIAIFYKVSKAAVQHRCRQARQHRARPDNRQKTPYTPRRPPSGTTAPMETHRP